MLMSAGSLLSLFVLRTVLGFVSWSVIHADVATRLIWAYSTAFHGAATGSLNCRELKNLELSLNKIIRSIWCLPYNLHVNLTHKIAGFSSIYNMVYSHCRKLFEAALQSQNPTVISVFSEAAAKCDTSIGFNSLFGPKYCRFYSEEEIASAYLICEIRLRMWRSD